MKRRIMIVEDDRMLANGVALALGDEDVELIKCGDLGTAREELQKAEIHLMILDVNLPDGNGLDFLVTVKKQYSFPVMLLTAQDMEIHIVTGLELGADDYVTKPFSLAVLRARVNTQLRKYEQAGVRAFQQDGFRFDFDGLKFYKNQQEIELSKTEQRLLKALVMNKGLVMERSRLIDRLWSDGGEYVDENALSVVMTRLRNKLEDTPKTPKYLKTIRGMGYSWNGGGNEHL